MRLHPMSSGPCQMRDADKFKCLSSLPCTLPKEGARGCCKERVEERRESRKGRLQMPYKVPL